MTDVQLSLMIPLGREGGEGGREGMEGERRHYMSLQITNLPRQQVEVINHAPNFHCMACIISSL